MPYKLTPGEIMEKFTDYARLCDNRMGRARRGTKMVAVRKPAMYDMGGFCEFAGLDHRTLPAMTEDAHYRQVIHDIRCAVLLRKLKALKAREGDMDALVAELDTIYGLQAKKVRRGTCMQWQLRFSQRRPGNNGRQVAPGAAIAAAVIKQAALLLS